MKNPFQPSRRAAWIAATGLVLLSTPAAFAALVITPTFSAGFNLAFGANAAAAQASWIAAASQLSANFSDNIHVNINVNGASGTSIFGLGQPTLLSTTYANLRSRLVTDSTTPDDATSVGGGGSVSAADPAAGTHTWWLTRAQSKAIGNLADDLSTDGTTTFGAGWNYTFSGPIAAGTYDFRGVAAREISEVMGRLGISGGTTGGFTNSFSVVDLLAYMGFGTRGMGFVAGDYFSFDNGTTLLKLFNAVGGGDSRDWASGSNDAFNAFSSSGVANPLTAVDFQIMDVIGYNLVPAPEPATAALLAGGLALGFGLCRLKR